jgi:hypothetical protein
MNALRIQAYIVAITILSFQTAHATQPVPHSFDEFVTSLIARDEQQPFRDYYVKKIDRIAGRSPAAQHKELLQIKKQAYCAVEVHHPQWLPKVAKPHAVQDIAVERTDFLVWYGVYLSYVRQTASSKGSMWAKLQTKKDVVKNKVSSWVGAIQKRKRKQTASHLA